MSETAFEVGQKVTILDVNKVGEVTAVSEDGQVTVKYTDDAGAEQNETGAPEKFAPVSGESFDEEAAKTDENEGSDEEAGAAAEAGGE